MIKVFFYLNFKNENYIKKISNKYNFINGKINIEYYNSKLNKFIINKNNEKNKNILNGKLYFFDISINQLIQKINKIKNIQIQNRIKYELDTVDVITDHGIKKKCLYHLIIY